ncbi:ureidoglycolate lyase [soil metagenome]
MAGARILVAEALTAEAFAPFGDVIEAAGAPDFSFNGAMADRFHDLARLDFAGAGARPGISIAIARPYGLPHVLDLVERHPLGSQAFVPLDPAPFLVVVAPDAGGRPGRPQAFLTRPGQGVNYLRGIWHGVLTPLGAPQRFLVIDRIAPGENLEEHRFAAAWTVTAA